MTVSRAKEYYRVIDDPETGPADLSAMYSEDVVLKSPREGTFRGSDAVEEFYELNAEFFAAGAHDMTDFYVDGDTVICEGTIAGETTAGREYEGVGLADIFEFDENDDIASHRIYLDYSAIRSDLPPDEAVPDFRA